MKTTKNNATNNFIVRIWSNKYYSNPCVSPDSTSGTITDTKTKEVAYFHSQAELLIALEKLNKKSEKARGKK